MADVTHNLQSWRQLAEAENEEHKWQAKKVSTSLSGDQGNKYLSPRLPKAPWEILNILSEIPLKEYDKLRADWPSQGLNPDLSHLNDLQD